MDNVKLDNLSLKLQFLGYEVLGYNTFGLVYRKDADTLELVKLDSNNNLTYKNINDSKNLTVDICKHFISISENNRLKELYVSNKQHSISFRYDAYRCFYYNGEHSCKAVAPKTDHKVIVILLNTWKIIAINYEGKTLDISVYADLLHKNLDFGIDYDSETDTYYIGCEDPDILTKWDNRWYKGNMKPKVTYRLVSLDSHLNILEAKELWEVDRDYKWHCDHLHIYRPTK